MRLGAIPLDCVHLPRRDQAVSLHVYSSQMHSGGWLAVTPQRFDLATDSTRVRLPLMIESRVRNEALEGFV